MARRSYKLPRGGGSFYQRQSDGRWIGSLDAGWTPNGTRRRVISSSMDKDVAWDKHMAALKAHIAGEGTTASPTVKAWVDEWLRISRPHMRPRSHDNHRSRLQRWVVPAIGRKRLDRLTPADVRTIHDAIDEAGREQTTKRNVHSTLMTVLRAAVEEGYMVQRAVLAVRKPPASAPTRAAIPAPDALRLIAYVSALPDGARWIAALLQGMRQGECLGLTWDAVDFDAGMIEVSWQLVQLKYADKKAKTFDLPPGYEVRQIKGGWHLARPKTRAGWRRVPMVPWMRDALLAWRERAPDNPWGLVWPRFDGAMARTYDEDRAEWYAILEACGVAKVDGGRFVLHEARHTAASVLLAAGVDVQVVQAIMGWSSIAMASTYQHADAALMREALTAAAERLQLE